MLDDSMKQGIGQMLLRLLREPELIEAWSDKWISRPWMRFFDNRFCNVILTWLEDPAVLTDLQAKPLQKSWVDSLNSDEKLRFGMLSNIAKTAADIWFAAKEPESEQWRDALSWLYQFYFDRQLREPAFHRQALYRCRTLFGSGPNQDSAAHQFETLEAWAKKESQNEREVVQWHICIGNSLMLHSHPQEAILRFQQALDIEPNLGKVRLQLVMALGEVRRFDEAIAAMEEMLEKKDTLPISDQVFMEQYWSEFLPSLVEWNESEGRNAAAEKLAAKMVDWATTQSLSRDYGCQHILEFVLNQSKQNKYHDIATVLANLSRESAPGDGTWL